ncbi:hypothetical protein H5410_018689, partial [Solanum commersonii]
MVCSLCLPRDELRTEADTIDNKSYSSAIWKHINGLQAHLAHQVDEGRQPLQQQQQHAYAAARV